MRVKICGLKTLDDVRIVNRYLPDYVGFVFADTKRFVTDEQAFAMKKALDTRIQAVGVFVNEPLEHVVSLCKCGIIDVVQLHGEEQDDYIRELKKQTDKSVIKAVRVQSSEQVNNMLTQQADYMLFDTYQKGIPGGSGERFPLEILQRSLEEQAAKGRQIQPFFLAGGLSPGNVTEVLANLECFGVDVSTGVETQGSKDEAKVRQFIHIVRKK